MPFEDPLREHILVPGSALRLVETDRGLTLVGETEDGPLSMPVPGLRLDPELPVEIRDHWLLSRTLPWPVPGRGASSSPPSLPMPTSWWSSASTRKPTIPPATGW